MFLTGEAMQAKLLHKGISSRVIQDRLLNNEYSMRDATLFFNPDKPLSELAEIDRKNTLEQGIPLELFMSNEAVKLLKLGGDKNGN